MGALRLLLATSNVAFYVVFSIFVVAGVVLSVITARWALRRDRSGRAAWVQRRRTETGAPGGGPVLGAEPARRNGSGPAPAPPAPPGP